MATVFLVFQQAQLSLQMVTPENKKAHPFDALIDS